MLQHSGEPVIYVCLGVGLLTRSDHSQRELTRMLNITTLPRRHHDPCLFGVRFLFWSARFTHSLTHAFTHLLTNTHKLLKGLSPHSHL